MLSPHTRDVSTLPAALLIRRSNRESVKMMLKTNQDVIAARNKIKSYTDKISELQREIREYYVNKNKKSLERDEKLQEIAALTFFNISRDFSRTKQKLLLSFDQLFRSSHPIGLKNKIDELQIKYVFQVVEKPKSYWSSKDKLGKTADDLEESILTPLGLFFGMPVFEILNANDFIEE